MPVISQAGVQLRNVGFGPGPSPAELLVPSASLARRAAGLPPAAECLGLTTPLPAAGGALQPPHGHMAPGAGMLNKRCRHGAASLGSKMFVCGGYDGSGFLSIAEVYSPVADQWCLIVPMLTRSEPGLAGGQLRAAYAVGAMHGQSNLSSVEMYDPDTDRWTFMAPMACHEAGSVWAASLCSPSKAQGWAVVGQGSGTTQAALLSRDRRSGERCWDQTTR